MGQLTGNQKLRRRFVPMRMLQHIERLEAKIAEQPEHPKCPLWKANLEKLVKQLAEDHPQVLTSDAFIIEVPTAELSLKAN